MQPPHVLPLDVPAHLRKVFAVSSLVDRRDTRPSRWRLEKAIFVKELLMSTRTNSAAGIEREFLLALGVKLARSSFSTGLNAGSGLSVERRTWRLAFSLVRVVPRRLQRRAPNPLPRRARMV